MMSLFRSVFLFSLLALSACDSARIFDTFTDLEGNKWPIAKVPTYTFEIKETAQAYDLFFNVRNSASYPFYNLYLRHELYGPDGKLLNSALHNLYLSDAKTGEPTGSGSGDLFDHQVRFMQKVHFKAPGKYTVKIKQYMRKDPLPDIMAIGLRVARSEV
jgi:gliding motility-associated lipoprotein GldH